MLEDSEESGSRLHPSLRHLMVLDRVTLDTSVLVGPKGLELAIAARQRYYRGHWSNWLCQVGREWIIHGSNLADVGGDNARLSPGDVGD